jgi:hypothetical protein
MVPLSEAAALQSEVEVFQLAVYRLGTASHG